MTDLLRISRSPIFNSGQVDISGDGSLFRAAGFSSNPGFSSGEDKTFVSGMEYLLPYIPEDRREDAVLVAEGLNVQVYRTPLKRYPGTLKDIYATVEALRNDENVDPRLLYNIEDAARRFEHTVHLLCKPGKQQKKKKNQTKSRSKRFVFFLLILTALTWNSVNHVRIDALGGRIGDEMIEVKEKMATSFDNIQKTSYELHSFQTNRTSELEGRVTNLTSRVQELELKHEALDARHRKEAAIQRINQEAIIATQTIENDRDNIEKAVYPNRFTLDVVPDWNYAAVEFLEQRDSLPEVLTQLFGTSSLRLMHTVTEFESFILSEEAEIDRSNRCSEKKYLANQFQSVVVHEAPVYLDNAALGRYIDPVNHKYVWIRNSSFLPAVKGIRGDRTISKQRRIETNVEDKETRILPVTNSLILVDASSDIPARIICGGNETTDYYLPNITQTQLKLPLNCRFESRMLNISTYEITLKTGVATDISGDAEVYH